MSNQDQWPSLDYRVMGGVNLWTEPHRFELESCLSCYLLAVWSWTRYRVPLGLHFLLCTMGFPFVGMQRVWASRRHLIMQLPAPVLRCLVVISLHLPDPSHTWPFPFPHRLLPHPCSSGVGKAHSPSGYSGSGALSLCFHTTFITFSTHQNSLDS